jgi:hypothetical protein
MGQLFGSLRPILVAATLAGCLALIVFVSCSLARVCSGGTERRSKRCHVSIPQVPRVSPP